MNTELLEIVFRLFLGSALGGIIGFERQSHGRPAGFRTHLLVCLASVLIMIVSYEYYRPPLDSNIIRIDPARIAAGAITGVGFLGAGVIIKSGFTIQGLTTAACLWIVSAIGLAVGSGLYFASIITFSITFVALWILRRFEVMMPRLRYKVLTLTTDSNEREEEIINFLKEAGADVGNIDYEMSRERGDFTYHISMTFSDSTVISRICKNLAILSYVKHFHLRG